MDWMSSHRLRIVENAQTTIMHTTSATADCIIIVVGWPVLSDCRICVPPKSPLIHHLGLRLPGYLRGAYTAIQFHSWNHYLQQTSNFGGIHSPILISDFQYNFKGSPTCITYDALLTNNPSFHQYSNGINCWYYRSQSLWFMPRAHGCWTTHG